MDHSMRRAARTLAGFLLVLPLAFPAGCDSGKVVRADAGDVHPMDLRFPETGGDDAAADVPSDVPANLPDELEDVAADVPADLPSDAPVDAEPPDAETDAQADVPPDLPPDAVDVPGDTGPDVPAPEHVSAWDPWDRVERFRIGNPGLVPETYAEGTTRTDTRIFEAFGTDTPGPGLFLLHSAKGWDAGGGTVVVLVHGAGTDADQAFAAPDTLTDRSLVKALAAEGTYRVFAVTFAHPFGDNDNHAIVLASALGIVRARTGAAQVAVVAHSKGGLAAAAYLKGREAKWGVPFAGDVERAVFLGAPLGGMDWSFRHPNATWTSVTWSLPMPSAWDKVLEYGQWKDLTDVSIYGGAYAGLLQALWPWDQTFALSMVEQDWYTTYYGGDGFVSHSRGIHAAITLGGGFVQALKDLPAPADVAVAAVAGGSALVNGVVWEATGPSDGMVFEDSARDLSSFQAAGCPVLGVTTIDLANHWELLYDDDATTAVSSMLAAAR